jgi:hypothetical protein
VSAQAGFSGGGRNGRRTRPAQGPIEATQTAAQWGQFVDSIKQHDDELLQERLATDGPQVTESVIQEVYQPTSLANGQRTGGGSKITQKVKLPYNKVAAASTNRQSSGLESGRATGRTKRKEINPAIGLIADGVAGPRLGSSAGGSLDVRYDNLCAAKLQFVHFSLIRPSLKRRDS